VFYKARDSVLTGTTEGSPQEKRLKIAHGVIVQWFIYAPPQGADLLRLRVFRSDQQLMPFNRDGYICPAEEKYPVPDHYEVFRPPYELVINAWNLAETDSHGYFVNVNILPEAIVGTKAVSPELVARVTEFFGV